MKGNPVKITKPAVFRIAMLSAVVLAGILPDRARGQDSSLFGPSQTRQPLTLADNSWTAQNPEETKTIKLNDLITVVVDVKSVMTSDGKMDRMKTASGDLALPNWIKFYKGSLGADGMKNGTPAIQGTVNNVLQSKANLQTTDALTFHIACRVVDIRPNGNLVLEGRRTVNNNEENWDYSLTGEVRPDSILPNRTILSDTVADLRIIKRETGHVRDGYNRGWFLAWLDKWQLF
jgi:flagellar L-ring protein precursor FlgH